jgi:hypothetical protein
MSEADEVAVSNLITAGGANQVGITSGSFANARVLARTALGPLYVIPGTDGVCLALASRVACSDYATRTPAVVALFAPDDTRHLVGGGLVAASASLVTVLRQDGSRVRATPMRGGFIVTSGDRIRDIEFAGLAAG